MATNLNEMQNTSTTQNVTVVQDMDTKAENDKTVSEKEKAEAEAEIAKKEQEKNNEIWDKELWPAIENRDQNALEEVLKRHQINIEFHHSELGTVLMHAIRNQDVNLMFFTLLNGANPDFITTTRNKEYTMAPLDMLYSVRDQDSDGIDGKEFFNHGLDTLILFDLKGEAIRDDLDVSSRIVEVQGMKDALTERLKDVKTKMDIEKERIKKMQDKMFSEMGIEKQKQYSELSETDKKLVFERIFPESLYPSLYSEHTIKTFKSSEIDLNIADFPSVFQSISSSLMKEYEKQLAYTKDGVERFEVGKQRLENEELPFYKNSSALIKSTKVDIANAKIKYTIDYDSAIGIDNIPINHLRAIILTYIKDDIFQTILLSRVNLRKSLIVSNAASAASSAAIDVKTKSEEARSEDAKKAPLLLSKFGEAAGTAASTSTAVVTTASSATNANSENNITIDNTAATKKITF